ncbi:transposase [Metarhizium robertsii ARSEF 23]|nr:transposase [Metarhizium robertsii ARSEF 23]KHO10620.1 transposase [Metarhizium robertsii ARSEF 23]
MEKLEAVEVDIEKNNGLITLSEKAAYIEAIMEKLKADQTDTEKKNALLGLSERAADIIARMQKLETAHVDTENTLRRMLAKLGAPCPI